MASAISMKSQESVLLMSFVPRCTVSVPGVHDMRQFLDVRVFSSCSKRIGILAEGAANRLMGHCKLRGKFAQAAALLAGNADRGALVKGQFASAGRACRLVGGFGKGEEIARKRRQRGGIPSLPPVRPTSLQAIANLSVFSRCFQ